jgi:hypothetical protein
MFVQKDWGSMSLCTYRALGVNKKFIIWCICHYKHSYLKQTGNAWFEMHISLIISSMVHICSNKTKNTNVFFFPTKREQTPQVFKSVLFSVAKCPSDYVKNVVKIAVCINSLWFMIAFILVFWYVRKNFVILGKKYYMSRKIFVCLRR